MTVLIPVVYVYNRSFHSFSQFAKIGHLSCRSLNILITYSTVLSAAHHYLNSWWGILHWDVPVYEIAFMLPQILALHIQHCSKCTKSKSCIQNAIPPKLLSLNLNIFELFTEGIPSSRLLYPFCYGSLTEIV